MKKISIPLISSLAALSLMVSCGKDSGGNSGDYEHTTKIEEEAAPPDGSNIQGFYLAKLKTLNPQVNGTVPGSVSFFRKEDRFMAYVRLFAGYPKAWHMQHVYEGNRCPTEADDLNGDGIIDIGEAEAVVGKILIPLDSDISSQTSGRRFFPVADPSGSYQYERATSFKRFLSDLQGQLKDPTGETTKLPPGEGLRLVGRPVIIFGISEEVQLPQSVGTKSRLKTFQTVPIACGIFEKADEVPGKAHDDKEEIPGPIAEIDPDQDRPASEEVPETPTDPSAPGRNSDGSVTNDSEDGRGPVSDGSTTSRTPPTTEEGTTPPESRPEAPRVPTTPPRTAPAPDRTEVTPTPPRTQPRPEPQPRPVETPTPAPQPTPESRPTPGPASPSPSTGTGSTPSRPSTPEAPSWN